MDIKEQLHHETEAKKKMNIYSSIFRIWFGILMTLITSLTIRLKSINSSRISLNQNFSLQDNIINGTSSFGNDIRRPDSKNAISKMSKSENKTMEPASNNVATSMSKSEIINNAKLSVKIDTTSEMRKSAIVSDSATPVSNISGEIPKLKSTTFDLKNTESFTKKSKDVFGSFPNSKNIVSDNSAQKHKIHKTYNVNKQQLKKFDLPHDSGALRESTHTSREISTINSLYQATTSGLMLKMTPKGKYNRRQYFFESWKNYFIEGIRQAIVCRISG